MTAVDIDSTGSLGEASTFRALAWVYGVAHGGKTLFWTASDLYFTFYMTEICGVAPAYTGATIGVSFLFAAFADLVLAQALSRSRLHHRSAGRMQAIGACASAVALLLFAGASFVPLSIRLGACIVALFGFRAAYALLDVPQNALLALATTSERERARLTAVRNVVGAIARTGLALAFVPVMTGQTPLLSGIAFLCLVLPLATVAITGALLLNRALGQRPEIVHTDPAPPRLTRTVLLLLVMMFIQTIATTGFMQIEPYFAAYGIADRIAAGIFMGGIALGGAVSQPLWLARNATRPSPVLLREALGVMVIGTMLLVILPPGTVVGSAGAGLIYGIGSGGVLFSLWASIARTAASGSAIEIIGRFTAAAKFGQGLAVMAFGLMLDERSFRGDGDHLAVAMCGVILPGVLIVGGLSMLNRGQRDLIVT
ncbi:hypothetical protein DBR17_03035 [Sphingomonas sp. HMWF008]|nr:hypothetical protein DBR17_03035 [Sphingomonas sp. HMWF008]